MVSSDQFQLSADHALMNLTSQIIDQGTQNPQMAAACFFRIQGAYEFITQLKTLAETPLIPQVQKNDQLDHRA